MTEEEGYHQRYCAFVDILGFRQLVSRLSEDASHFEALRGLLEKVHSRPQGADGPNEQIRTQSISDAVAMSTAVTPGGLADMLDALQALCIDLLCQGFFVRGAVVKGQLYHDHRMVFGEALVKAFHFESEVARFPRIIVLRDVREDMLKYQARHKGQRHPRVEVLRQSDDGPMYLDVLGPIVSLGQLRLRSFNKLSDAQMSDLSRYAMIRDRIQQRFEESMDQPRHFEKVQWFARYWNEVAATERTGFSRILGAGLDRKLGDR
jgi:hypothetical protein